MHLFRVFFLWIIVLLLWSASCAALPRDIDKHKYSSINELIRNGRIQASIMGSGSHEGECMAMFLENSEPDTVFIRIEPGRVLTSIDTAIQDILITREELFALAPGGKTTVGIFGFCCQASYAPPDSAELFQVGNMADSAVVALAEFLNERENNFPEDAIQHAIWCLTDDYSVNEITGEDLASIADLRNMVIGLKGMDEALFNVGNVPGNGAQFSQYIKSITGEFEIYIPSDCIVDIFICDEKGKHWDEFEEDVPYKAGTYQYSFKLTTSNWPGGQYFFCFMANDSLLYKKAFDL